MTWEEIKEKWLWRGTLSRWFMIYFFGAIFAWSGASTIVEHHLHGGTYEQAYWAMGERVGTFGLTYLEIFGVIFFWVGLLWFAFFSRSKRVTEDDKRYVRLWTVVSALMTLISLFRYILRAL